MAPELRPRNRGPPGDHNYSDLARIGYPAVNTTAISFVRVPVVKVQEVHVTELPDGEPQLRTKDTEETETPKVKKIRTGPVIRKRRRKAAACYDFGMPRKSKKRKKCVLTFLPDEMLRSSDGFQDDGLDSSEVVTEETEKVQGNFLTDLPAKSRKVAPKITFMCDICGENVRKSKKREICQVSKEKHSFFSDRRKSVRLVIKNYKLPFKDLPSVCKLRIFSFLSPFERASAALVCQEWCAIVNTPILWNHLDLCQFGDLLSSCLSKPSGRCRNVTFSQHLQYSAYKTRMQQFFLYLKSLDPCVKHLTLKFDLMNAVDDWLTHVLDLLNNISCQGLRSLDCDWTTTPHRPQLDRYCCLINKVKTIFRRHVLRVNAFHKFLDTMTKRTPYIQEIQMPFDWSAKSVLLLSRFHNVRSLSLSKYIGTKPFSQELLDTLLRSMPHLQKLTLEIYRTNFRSHTLFTIQHSQLQTLDLSQCCGVFFKSLDLPRLQCLNVGRNDWKGSLVDGPEGSLVPCLYRVLTQDCRQIELLNKHMIHPYWQEFIYEELEMLLAQVCSCEQHWQRMSNT